MNHRPVALISMSRRAFEQQFGQRHLERLRRNVTLAEPAFLEDLCAPGHEAQLAEVEVLFTSWGTPLLSRELLDRMPKLSAVFHCAGTVKQMVGADFWERGIPLTNAADVNAIPVAEFAFASILLAGKKAQFVSRARVAKRVVWKDAEQSPFGPLSNYGQQIGIVGFSRTGRLVVERITRTMSWVKCWVVDPYADEEKVAAAGGYLTTLDEMLPKVSIVSVHAPELPETYHMLGARELGLLPDHATVINTARGSLIDTAALETECLSGRLNAVLDVTDPEPLPDDSVLHELQNVSITPHIAGSLGTETFRMTDRAIDELERFVGGEAPISPVRSSDLEISA